MALLVAALAALSLLAAGCGGGEASSANDGAGTSEAFSEELDGLKEAALDGDTTYEGAKRAKENLDVPEDAVLDAFCETAWQLEINGETNRLTRTEYIFNRIKAFAEYDLGDEHDAAIKAAMAEVREVVDLESLTPEENLQYKEACYQE